MLKASLADMERDARAGLGDGPADVVVRMKRTQQPLANGYAMNWQVHTLQGHDLVMHEGGTGGFSSIVALDPAAHRAVVLLADTALADLGGLGDVGLSLLGLDVPVQPPRKALPPPEALVTALIGDYRFGSITMSIRRGDDGRVTAQIPGQPAFALSYDSHGDFYPGRISALLKPLRPVGDAPVQRFTWHQGGGVIEARRIGGDADAPPVITNPAWRDWAGEFQLMNNFSLRVFEADGKLMVQGTGQPAIEATPTGPDRIEIARVGAIVEFERDSGGRVIAAILHQGGQTLRGAKR
jgi:D-alanyl-D-alanine-carboxypeptidase/D-alanyl-D-alanine-endopeptidase